MPIVHQPAGSPKGGQFAPGGSSNSSSASKGKKKKAKSKVPPAAQKYLAAVAAAEAEDAGKGGAPHLTGTPTQNKAALKYLKALHKANHKKVLLNRRTVKKVRHGIASAAKKKARAATTAAHKAQRAKASAARKAARAASKKKK